MLPSQPPFSSEGGKATPVNYIELFSKVKNFLYNEEVLKDSDENIIQQACSQHYIKLEKKGYSYFPDFLLYSKSLKSELDVLILSYNKIQSIPPEIIQFDALKVLDLSHNHNIKNFTYELMNLKNLKALDLSYNRVEKIPDAFFEKMVSKIMVLKLSSNNISFIGNGNWSNLASTLIELDLADNKLSIIPHTICDLVNLTFLNFAGNQISVIPKEFYKLTKLKQLNLNRNRIRELPTIELEDGRSVCVFYNMRGLEHFDISRNSIHAKDLRGLGSITSLKAYLFSNNKLTHLSSRFEVTNMCKNLQIIDISNNELQDLPTILADTVGKYVTELNISNNYISTLGENFGKFIALKRLLMSKNYITELPTSFARLHSLIVLKASHNEISVIPEECFNENMKELKDIDLDYNCLRQLPKSIGALESLISLRVEHNTLMTLPDTIVNCPYLYGIYAAYNELSSLPENIGSCKRLRKIHVEYNFLKALPPSLKNLKYLEIINFDHNSKELIEFMKNQIELDKAEKERILAEYTEKYEKMKNQTKGFLEKISSVRRKKDFLDGSINEAISSTSVVAASSSNNISTSKDYGSSSTNVSVAAAIESSSTPQQGADMMKTPAEFMAEQTFLSDILQTKTKEVLQWRRTTQ
ncbi:hypothetical protein C9374_002313 [Naegleria lovaniensis]|uniref:Leucine-rich repeat protein n=1 Tax=Naegleria lovaniensis TaxID=51637 RepID=A0AA88GVP8_NAELO|nr:uncharacterized protein C9374_002313 [Naegleria lovaniensis]KAG2386569.1 hypothetical protein C9374_002313 [Naegleria lovaniensis]